MSFNYKDYFLAVGISLLSGVTFYGLSLIPNTPQSYGVYVAIGLLILGLICLSIAFSSKLKKSIKNKILKMKGIFDKKYYSTWKESFLVGILILIGYIFSSFGNILHWWYYLIGVVAIFLIIIIWWCIFDIEDKNIIWIEILVSIFIIILQALIMKIIT